MTEIKVEDVLIPLLNSDHYINEIEFNKKFKEIRINPKPLYLEEKFGFSIDFISIISYDDLNKEIKNLKKSTETFELIFENDDKATKIESLDDSMFEKTDLDFKRNIFRSTKGIKIEIKDSDNSEITEEVTCSVFINIAEIHHKNHAKLPYHIFSVILTSYNHKFKEWNNGKGEFLEKSENEFYNLSNKQIIALMNKNFSFSFPGIRKDDEELDVLRDILGIRDIDISDKEKKNQTRKKNTFIAIQLWNHHWKNAEDNMFDAKEYVRKNPYYFYSILTLEENIFRRTYENIMDVLGWCQSASSVYFDIFYGTTCLELTIKPKKDSENEEYNKKFFDETGHDSEEFRIWELLALQKELLMDINKKNLNNVDKKIEELDLVYNFNIFTKKKGKGERWIRYGKYLQRITGIDSEYQDYKLKSENKNKEQESKLQKLNFLIIISIFVSFLTLLLDPIYGSWVSDYNDSLINSTFKFYVENIVRNPLPEVIAILVAFTLTSYSLIIVYKTEIISKLVKKKLLIFVSIISSLSIIWLTPIHTLLVYNYIISKSKFYVENIVRILNPELIRNPIIIILFVLTLIIIIIIFYKSKIKSKLNFMRKIIRKK